jgi:hypothetical protein
MFATPPSNPTTPAAQVPRADAARRLARALIAAAGLVLANSAGASATPFTYEITFATWNSSFDSLAEAAVNGTFTYDPATLVPLTPPSSPTARVTYAVGPGTSIDVTSGAFHFALDLTQGPATLQVTPPLDPRGTSSLVLFGRYSSNALPPGQPGFLMFDAANIEGGPLFTTNDLTTPINFSGADIGLTFSSIGSLTLNRGLRLVPEPAGAGAIGLAALALFAALRRRRAGGLGRGL